MKQEEIEKAAEDYAERKRLEFDDCSFKDALKRDFKSGADFVNKYWQEKTRWIPVEERLPDFNNQDCFTNKECLVKIIVGSMSPKIYYKVAWLESPYKWSCEGDWIQVTHWKEID